MLRVPFSGVSVAGQGEEEVVSVDNISWLGQDSGGTPGTRAARAADF